MRILVSFQEVAGFRVLKLRALELRTQALNPNSGSRVEVLLGSGTPKVKARVECWQLR